jgi:hypothetical protein
MKTNLKHTIAALLAMLAAGCTKNATDDINFAQPTGGKSIYTMSVGGEKSGDATTPDTRAEMGDDRVYRWSAADKVGFYATVTGTTTPVLDNIRLVGVNATPVTRTDFDGELSREQIERFDAETRYDYYSYYPYDAATAGFPNITVNMSASRTITPDVFDNGCLMIARTTDRGPVTWLEVDGTDVLQRFGEKIGFSYEHVFSYIELYLACNLMSQRITRIVITDNGGGVLAGDCTVDLRTGAVSMTNTSSTLTLDIEGGMDVLDGRLYIPVPAADLSSHSFRITLTTEHGNSVTMDLPRGANFQKGKIHKLALKVPFLINFSGVGSSGRAPKQFTFKGYNFSSNGNPEMISNNNQFRFEAVNSAASGAFYYEGGDITKDNAARGTLTLPAINVANTAGRSDIPVKVEILGNGEAVTEGTLNTHRLFFYQPVTAGYDSYLQPGSLNDSNFGTILAGYESAPGSYDDTQISSTGNKVVNLTSEKPSLALHYIGNFVSITFGGRIINHGHLFQVKLIPDYTEPGFE